MKKRCLVMALAMLTALAVSACGSAGKSSSYAESADTASAVAADYNMTAQTPMEAPEAAEEEYAEAGGVITSDNGIEPVAESGRKLIKNVRLELQTLEFEEMISGLTARVQEIGGYIQDSSLYGSSYNYSSSRSADYTVRIPVDQLDEFVEVVSGLGNVTYKNESVEDVTLEYVDTESRKKSLETEQERLIELLSQAESLEDILAIESKLSEVRYELENYGSRLRYLDNQIDYSTVYVNIQEVERITEVRERTYFEEIADRFGDSLYTVFRGLRGFSIGLLGSLPILAVWAAVLAAAVLIIRKIFYRKKKDRTQKKRWWEKRKKNDPADIPPKEDK